MITALLLLSAPANAWEHLTPTRMWSPDDIPLIFYTSSYLEDSLPQVPDSETGRFPQEDLAIKSFCNWHWTDYCDEQLSSDWQQYDTAECADVRYEYGGQKVGHTGQQQDGAFVIYWDDPRDELATGVNGVSQSIVGGSVVKTIGGSPYKEILDCDITMNNEIVWGLTNDMEDSCPQNTMSAESTLTHEIGHCLGLAHSCEEEDLCVESSYLNATMFWSGGPCDTSRASIGQDDMDSVTAIYGPFISWNVTEDSVRFGPVPLEVCFELEVDDQYLAEIDTIEWSFGDGTTSDELEPCHTFEKQGQFSVTALINGVSDVCGEWQVAKTQRAHVLVCEEPLPDFDLQPDEGLIYQLVNMTDVSTYGCLDGLQWEVYAGASAEGEPVVSYSAWSPKIEFPDEGEYTVKLTAMGPAGEASTDATFDIEETRAGVGCSSSSSGAGFGGAGFGIAGLALAMVLGRRRRR